jgi:glycosyltransferase involved in cell wall biosynthesis
MSHASALHGPLIVAELAGSAGYGGGERYLELLLNRLDRARYRPLLVCPEPGPFVRRMTERGVPSCVVHLAPLVNPLALLRLAMLFRREGVRVLQTHGARSTFYGALAGRVAGVAVIVATIHNSLSDYEIEDSRRRLYTWALRRALRQVDRVICVSEALRDWVVRSLGVPTERAVTIYNGLDPEGGRPSRDAREVRRELQMGEGPILLAVGRLTEQKGHRYLLAALQSLLAEWPGLRCVIVGDGELREELPILAARLGVASACVFTGVRADIPDLLQAADVVVLPSVSEGFPFVLLEALRAERPIVATCIEGVTELIQNERTGRLVPPRDAGALAGAVQALLRDPLGRRAMGDRGGRLVRDRFTADQMVAQTVALFEASWQDKGQTVAGSEYRSA